VPRPPGLVHAVSGFLLERAGNIEEAAQFNDHDTGLFFMRVQFACSQLSHEQLKHAIWAFAAALNLQWKLHATHSPCARSSWSASRATA
jgi:formyltetrahydrofolate deformylase